MRAVIAVGAVALALALTSCAVGSPYPAFDRAATEEDQLPSVFYQSEFDGYNSSFANRFAGTYDGRDYYLIKTEAEGNVCLAVDAGEDSVIACGGAPGVTASGPGYTAQLAPAPLEEREGWTIVGDNIRVLDDSE
ncbi:hypothetical protein BH10ACT7_BH10ACT7_31390 [soil metagenome]